jgi:hypothetical protein
MYSTLYLVFVLPVVRDGWYRHYQTMTYTEYPSTVTQKQILSFSQAGHLSTLFTDRPHSKFIHKPAPFQKFIQKLASKFIQLIYKRSHFDNYLASLQSHWFHSFPMELHLLGDSAPSPKPVMY